MTPDTFTVYRLVALWKLMDNPSVVHVDLAQMSGDIAEACCRDDERRMAQPPPSPPGHEHKYVRTQIEDSSGIRVIDKCHCGKIMR